MTSTEQWTPKPARGDSWAPFAPGHTKSIRHGVWSKRKIDPLAEELVACLLADREDLSAYPELLLAWGRAEARCLVLADWYADGFFDDDGKERPGLRYIHQWERLASELRVQLGLTPSAEAELTRVRADAVKGEFDLEALMARGREARLAAEQRHAVEASQSPSDAPDHDAATGVRHSAQVAVGGDEGLTPRSPHPS